jgi:hypothetical protein
MKWNSISRWVVAMVACGWFIAPRSVEACAACFGKSDDAMARGMNMGIFSLLVVILSVLAGITAFAIFLARRAARFPMHPVSTAAPTSASESSSSHVS